jgi:hypothetical protein
MTPQGLTAPSVALLLLSFATTAYADPSATDQSLAQSLFEQAKQLMDSGRYAEACPKFAESERLDPGGGTLLNLALCYERQGRVASAWSNFKEASSLARRDGRSDRAQAAEEHIRTLVPKLPRLTIQAPNAVEGETILLDGVSIGRAAWGVPVAVDPGPHQLVASAPGKVRWMSNVTFAMSEQRSVSIPELQSSALPAAGPASRSAAAASPASSPADLPRASGGSAGTWALLGGGVVALGAGSVLGVMAIDRRHKSNGACPTDTTCTDQGVKWNNQAKTFAWASDIGIGIGLLGVGIGTYLLLVHGADAPRAARAAPPLSVDAVLSAHGGALRIGRAF